MEIKELMKKYQVTQFQLAKEISKITNGSYAEQTVWRHLRELSPQEELLYTNALTNILRQRGCILND